MMSRTPEVIPDALLVQRMAALSDRTALLELDARHGMTLYALAYGLLFDGEAADVAVAAALREAWAQRGGVRRAGRERGALARVADAAGGGVGAQHAAPLLPLLFPLNRTQRCHPKDLLVEDSLPEEQPSQGHAGRSPEQEHPL